MGRVGRGEYECFGKSHFFQHCVLWEEGFWAAVTRGVRRVGSELPAWAVHGGREPGASSEAPALLGGQGTGLGTKEYQPVQTGRQPAHQ